LENHRLLPLINGKSDKLASIPIEFKLIGNSLLPYRKFLKSYNNIANAWHRLAEPYESITVKQPHTRPKLARLLSCLLIWLPFSARFRHLDLSSIPVIAVDPEWAHGRTRPIADIGSGGIPFR
jgi:hypothetical protein